MYRLLSNSLGWTVIRDPKDEECALCRQVLSDMEECYKGLLEPRGCLPMLAASLGYNVVGQQRCPGMLVGSADTEALLPSWTRGTNISECPSVLVLVPRLSMCLSLILTAPPRAGKRLDHLLKVEQPVQGLKPVSLVLLNSLNQCIVYERDVVPTRRDLIDK